MRSPPLRSR